MKLCFKQQVNSIKSPYVSQKLVYLLGIAISFILMIVATGTFSGNPSENMAIYAFLVLIISLAISVNFDLSHPFIWFNIIFTVYSLSTPIMNIMGEYIFYPEYSKNFDYIQVIFAQYLAVLVFSLAVGPKRISYNLSIYKAGKINSYLFRGCYYVLIFGSIISLLYLYGIIHYGVEEKTEKIAEYIPILGLSFCWTIITVSIVTILMRNKLLGQRLPFILILLFTCYFPLCLLVGGDRHPVFYYLLTLIITINIFYKKIKFRYFLAVLVLGMYLSTISGAFKMFLMSDTTLRDIGDLLLFDYRNILLTVICSEFRTASENLAVILQGVPYHAPFLHGKLLFAELFSVFIPTFLFPRGTFETSVFWYNRIFFPKYFETGAGVGFSLVAEGYVNFGYPGIVGLFLFLGWAIRKLYNRSASSLVFLIFYLCFIPIFVLAIRADLATIVSQGLKHILVSILLMFVIGKYNSASRSPAPTAGQRINRRPSFWRLASGRTHENYLTSKES